MDFKEFMLPELKEQKEDIITFKGVDTFKDKEGNPIPIQFRRIGRKEYRRILKEFKKKTPALNNKGDYIISGGKLVYDEDTDYEEFNDTVITKAMVSPDLYDKELMKFYGVYSAVDLLNVLFKGKDYDYIDKCCSQACGFSDPDPKEVISELKN